MRTNFDILKEFMDFSDPKKFYLVLVIQRLKDNPGMKQSDRIIKNYMIPSLEKLERVRPEMETLCSMFNARVYMYINRRSYKGTQKAMLKTLCDQLCSENDESTNLNHLFDSCAASHGCGDKHWIIDVDMHRNEWSDIDYDHVKDVAVDEISKILDNALPALPEGTHRVELVLPTKSGFHIVTSPFDTREWSCIRETVMELDEALGSIVDVELKKDAMVNLILKKDI